MKKKFFLTLAIILCFTVFCTALVACVENTTEQGKPDNNTDGTSPDDGDQSGDDSDDDLDETPDAFVEFKLIFIVDEAEYHYIETAGNETIKLPDNPEKVGYVFDGWFWDKDIWSQPLTVSSFIDRPLTNDMKVYAKWITEEEAELSVVTFETNGGSELSAIRTNTLENAPVSVRNGYVLEGWYFTSSLNTEEKAIFPLTVTSDICLYAKWIPVRYQISYQTNGGVLPNDAKREYTIEEQVELPVPTNEGFTFAGWYETEDFTGAQVEVISIGQTGDRNYYAKWQVNEYSIEFDTVGGSAIEAVHYNFGAVITAPDAPQKTGYDFKGWYEDISYSTAFIFDKMPARNVKLYAKWSATRYDITYKIDGGILPAEAWTEYTIEDEYTLPQPQKEGLIFAGWYDNAELIGERVVRIVKGTTGNKEFWAKWDASGYRITYHLDGGVNGNNPPSYDVDSADIVFEDPYKTGHTFMGWFDNGEYAGEAITGIPSGSEGNKELWAKWQINTYSIRFVTNGGNEIADVEYEYNEQISAPVAPSRKGYYFEGWHNEELTEQYVFNRMPASDLTLYAKWTIEEYSITYFTYGGELPEGVILNNTYTVEDAITLPILEKEGHTFNGWYDNADFNGEPISGIAEGSTGSLLLYAKFTINSYTITFKNDDDSVITTVTQDFGTQLEAPEVANKNGYEFEGWFLDLSSSEIYIFGNMPAANLTIYAKWSIINYTIEYAPDGGSMPETYPTTYTVESNITLPAPQKTGYNFCGWYENENLTGEAIFEIALGTTGNKEYYAKYELGLYTITFDSNGGSKIENITQYYNVLITEPAAPTRYGYNFVGWFVDKNYSSKYEFDKMPAENITVYAKWSAIIYSITYHNVDDAENINPTSYTVEDVIQLATPVKNGYTFSFWYLDGNTNNIIVGISAGTTGNLNIYASWIKADNGYSIVSAPNYAFISDSELKTVVEYETTEFDFRGTFTVSANASWRAFTQADCSPAGELTLRTATDLEEGDNYYYILVENNSTYLSQVYTINVYRGHLYNVSLYNKSGSVGQSFELYEGSAITEDTIDANFDLTSVGYRLLGWYFDSDYEEAYIVGNAINKNQKNINLYSKYEAITYQIKYELNGGINSDVNPSSYTIEDANITLSDPTREGWTFDGWWLDTQFVTPITEIITSSLTDYAIYAKWVPFEFEEDADGNLTVVSYNQAFEEIVIPSTVRDKNVVGIADTAFANSTSLKSIIIPDSIVKIASGAFVGCSALEKITIPFVGTEAGKTSSDTYQYPFGYIFGTVSYTGGTEVTQYYYGSSTSSTTSSTYYIPLSLCEVTVTGGNVLYGAFYGCSMLTSVTIPDSATSIGDSAFYGCSGLASITISDGVTSIGDSAFYGCNGLTSITISDGVTSIGSYAFYNCTGLVEINWNAVSVADFNSNSNVFYNAGTVGAGIAVTFGENVQKIPAYLFYVNNSSYSPNIRSVIIGSGVTSIGGSAFEDCTGLTSVTIPDSVTSIGYEAFYGCTGLTSVTIGASVESIGSSAFRDCYKLVEVYSKSSLDITAGSTSNGYVGYYAKNVYTEEGGSWLTDTSDGYRFLYDGTNGYLIGYRGNQTELALPASFTAYDGTEITEYGLYDYAFYKCSGLTSITISDGVTGIGSYAFYGCTGLTEINWNAVSVADFDYYSDVFYNAGTAGAGITVTFGESVEKIPAYLFYASSLSYSPNIKSVIIGSGVTSIGSYAFYNCTGLTEINWNAVSVADFDYYSDVFYNAGTVGAGITVTFGENVQKIPAYLFYASSLSYSPNIKSVIIGSDVTSIGSYAFRGCTAEIVWGDDPVITEIGEYAFAGYKGTSITIPDGVTSIGAYTFSGCTGLTSVTIGEGVTSIGSYAFYNCTGLTEINWNAVSVADFDYNSNVFYNAGTAGDGITVTFGESVEKIPAYLFYVNNSSYSPNIKSVIIGSGVTSIGSYAFYNCSGLMSITIPAGVTSIGSYAFYNCTGLAEINWNAVSVADLSYSSNVFYNAGTADEGIAVTFGNSVEKIPAYLFYVYSSYSSSYSPNIKSVIIGTGVTSIGSSAFYNCSGLTSITIPDGVTSIGSYAFDGCTGLTSVTIGTGVTSIGSYAFAFCYGLTSITIPGSVTSIGSCAFHYCTGLKSITIPDSVTSIGGSAFDGCTGLTEINWNAVSVADFDYNSYVFYNAGTAGAGITVTFGDSVEKIPARLFDVNNSSYRPNIKSVIIGTGVTSIGSSAFRDCTGLTSVTIGNGVTSIGSSAFYNCSGLTSITIPDGVTSIGSDAFRDCTGLTSITIPDSVTSIGSYAFRGCTAEIVWGDDPVITEIGVYAFAGYKGTSITIPDSVTSIRSSAFEDCTGLKSITIPAGVTSIGSSAFYNCTGLTEINWNAVSVADFDYYSDVFYNAGTAGAGIAVTFGESVQKIPAYAFEDCTGLTSVTIGAGVTSIGSSAFYNCSGLTSITIPDGVTSIGSDAFRDCTGLTSITIPDSVTSIGSDAFRDCTGLTSITLPDSVTSIGGYAFRECTGLTSVTIGNGVTSIGNYAFYNCTGLTSVYYTGDIAGWCGISGLDEVMSNRCTLYIDGNKVEGAITIPDGVTSIPSYAFAYQTGLTSVTIPDSVTSIGSSAFRECTGLTSVTIGTCVTSIGSSAFRECTGLTSVTIGAGVTSIGYRAFEDCTGLTSVTIGNGVTSIGDSAFYDCTGLTSVYYTGDIAGWCGITFSNWSSTPLHYAGKLYIDGQLVTDLVIPDTVTEIKDYAFSGCEGLTSVTIPDSVTSIGEEAFYNCRGLTSVTIGNSVESIGSSAFYNCTGLTSLTIPDSVTSIGEGAFRECTGLTSVTIPDSVTSIGEGAFRECTGLKSITIPDSVTSIGSYAFYNCTGLTEINWNAVSVADFDYNSNVFYNAGTAGDGITATFGESVQKIPAYAFEDCTGLTSVTIGAGVTSIGYRAFYNCTGLTSITIPDGVTSIGSYAFEDCTGLKSITIPDSVTSIGGSAFDGCSGLTSVTIGTGVTSIGEGAFAYCTGLTSITVNENNLNYKSIDGNVYSKDGTVLVQYAIGKTANTFEIPDSVTSIGSYAFAFCYGLTSVTIGNSVTSIGLGAFAYCTGLTSVTIGNSVTSIRDGAFMECTGLTSITIPDSVTSVGSYAFAGCLGLTSITIPDSVTSIGNYAFYYCTGLTSVTIPDSVTSIGSFAFRECTGLTSVTIGNSVTSLGEGAFAYCSGLTSITVNENNLNYKSIDGNVYSKDGTVLVQYAIGKTANTFEIPDGVTSIGSSAFAYCTGLTSITIPDSVTSIGEGAFAYCTGLTSVTIPYSVTSIGRYAFEDCTGLTSVSIPGSVTSIGSSAFRKCTGLTSVTIPDSVTSIGSYAFEGCYKLVEVYNKSSLSITAGSTSNGYIGYYAKNIYTAEGGSWLTYTSDGYRFLYDGTNGYLMGYYGNQTELTLPASFTAYDGTKITEYGIYRYAFYKCSGLTSVTIGAGVKSIGDYAFYNCSGLTSVTIGAGVTSIGSYAFYNCTGLTSVSIPGSVTSIGSSAFAYCTGLTSVTIGTGVTSIGSYAFEDCTGLKSITIPDSVTSIGGSAFDGCSGLTSVTIGTGVTSIGEGAFAYCTGLTSVYYTGDIAGWCGISGLDEAMSRGRTLYIDGSKVEGAIAIPDGVTSIPSYAFAYHTGITSVTIPDSVTSIGRYAFSDCTGLTSVTFEETSGWFVSTSSSATSGTDIPADLSDKSTAAEYLRSTYYNCYWKRNA